MTFASRRLLDDWLWPPVDYLEGGRPIDLLAMRRVDEVLDALDAAEQRAWGG